MSQVEIRVSIDGVDNLSQTIIPCVNIAIFQSISDSLLVIRDLWQQKAQQKLHTTRADYLLGLNFDSIRYPYDNSPFSGAVVLQGKFPNMLEEGFPPYDMKASFMNSPNKKVSAKGGWYVNIPFRHSTPGRHTQGTPMPRDIYQRASQLPNWGSISVKGGQETSWKGYQHKANKYDGLTRIIKAYGKSTQSQYMTFRRMSDKSNPSAWWHPGHQGVKIAESIETEARKIFENSLKANIAKVFGN